MRDHMLPMSLIPLLLASVALDLRSQLVFRAADRFPAAISITHVGAAEALHVVATRARADVRRIRAFHRTAHRLVLARSLAVAFGAGRRPLRVDALRPVGIRVVAGSVPGISGVWCILSIQSSVDTPLVSRELCSIRDIRKLLCDFPSTEGSGKGRHPHNTQRPPPVAITTRHMTTNMRS